MIERGKCSLLSFLIAAFFAVCATGFAGTYWVSPTGTATWQNCQSAIPLNGAAACSLSTANSNAIAGDMVKLRSGNYVTPIQPKNPGRADAKITFVANEASPIISGHNQWGTFYGILLSAVSYIKVEGIKASDVDRLLGILYGASHNEISNCILENASVAGIMIWQGSSSIQEPKPYVTNNWIHGCTIRQQGFVTASCDDAGGLMQIGVPTYDGNSNNNTIENNIWYSGAHHIMETYTLYNVIRGNVFHNEGWMDSPGGCPYTPDANGKYGNRNVQLYDGHNREGTYNLMEGNRLGHAGQPPDDDGGSNMELTSPKNIIRYNSFFNGTNDGLYFKVGTGSYSNNNRVYNNTIFHNGYKVTSGMQSRRGIRLRNDITGNVILNNIIYNNYGGDFSCTGYPCTINQLEVRNNWLNGDGDPKFVDPILSDTFSYTLPDLHLRMGSRAIDKGTHLTTATTAGSNSTNLIVGDALMFQDGTWGATIAPIEPDEIAIGSVNNFVRISKIDYSTNVITLEKPATWQAGDKVWLYTKSDGIRVLYGASNDQGAYEYQVAPPSNLRVVN